jgi:hypothetical protein
MAPQREGLRITQMQYFSLKCSIFTKWWIAAS